MAAVAISQKDEDLLVTLQGVLKLASKAQVIHQALEVLKEACYRDRLATDIRKSVAKCSKADFEEHRILSKAASYRRVKG